jgi:hypothetical protein
MDASKDKVIENVVYILGAGFSAPTEMPVMSNFLDKSKDMFSLDPETYSHFSNVFNTIDRMHKSKSYFDTYLFNIEEILSILEMSEEVENEKQRSYFVKYVLDVIKYFTPDKEFKGYIPQEDSLDYGSFVSNLLHTTISSNSKNEFFCNPISKSEWRAKYSVITLNYDMILENCFEALKTIFNADKSIGFSTQIETNKKDFESRTHLAKLHGSVHTQKIVPPTWNKTLNQDIKPAWQLAYKLLAEANQIRIIGYSLPASDSYIKYLLKAAIINSQALKKIDIICLDDENKSAEKRYKEFIHFPNRSFVNKNTSDYLSAIFNQHYGSSSLRKFNLLEHAHIEFMKNK